MKMKAENTTRIQFDSLSVNEAYARGAAAAFLARYDPTVPQLADLYNEETGNKLGIVYLDHLSAKLFSMSGTVKDIMSY